MKTKKIRPPNRKHLDWLPKRGHRSRPKSYWRKIMAEPYNKQQ